MQEIWTVIEPYITTILSAILGGTGVYALCRFFLGKVLKKFSATYDINDMADKVAGKLAGKTLNIDVTAVTEKKLDKIAIKLDKKVEAVTEQIASYKQLLALIGGALVHLKSLTEKEKQGLTEAIKALNADYEPIIKNEVATIKLEPIIMEDRKGDLNKNDISGKGGITL